MNEVTRINTDKLKLTNKLAIDFPAIKYTKGGQRIMLVSDSVFEDDIDQSMLFGGASGQTLSNIVDTAIKDAGCEPEVLYCCSTKCYDPTKLAEIEIEQNRRKNIDYIAEQVVKFKIDTVVLLGQQELIYWLRTFEFREREYTIEQLRILRGRLLPIKFGDYHCNLLLSISPNNFASMDYGDFRSKVNTIGFVMRDLSTAILGKNRYTLPAITGKHQIISNIKQFKRFYRKLLKAKTPCFDTETINLQRVYGNRTLVILVSLNGNKCYMLPFMHPQTPFTSRELQYIKRKMRHYFETSTAKYHIYQNAKFDIMRFYVDLGVRFYNADIYDISSGEFGLDENRKFLDKRYLKDDGLDGVYNLELLTAQYGALGYEDSKIKKSDRDRMIDFSLEEIMDYGCRDVCYPYWICKFQQFEAKRRGPQYKLYLSSIINLGGDMIHVFTDMEKNGVQADRKYIHNLLSPASPLNIEIEKAKTKLRKNKNIQKANKILLKQQGAPKANVGIWQQKNDAMWVFDINKPKHMQLLFFDLLKLEPLAYRKDGGGKTGKDFLNEYKETVPEVEILANFREFDKLKNTYTTGLYKTIIKDQDNYTDYRIRSFFHYLLIISGRTGSSKPNAQNMPSRGKLAKIIKRIFICRSGYIVLKIDFNANEVRGWCNISADKVLAKAFSPGVILRRKLRLLRLQDLELDKTIADWIKENNWEDKKLTMVDINAIVEKYKKSNLYPIVKMLYDLKTTGDVHRMNYQFFFGKAAAEVTDDERGSVKTTVFGVLYEKQNKSLARDVYKKQTQAVERKYREPLRLALNSGDENKYNKLFQQYEAEMQPYWEKSQELIDKMFSTFKQGAEWIRKLKKDAAESFYIPTPFSMVRHLWGYMHAKKTVHRVMDRRTGNSAIQGSSSQIGYIGARIMQRIMWQTRKLDVGWTHTNFVHDAVVAETKIAMLPLAMYYLEHSMTTQVHKRVKEIFGYEMILTLEIDMEIGGSEGKLNKWDGTLSGFMEAVSNSIDFMITELEYKLDKAELLKKVEHNFKLIMPYRIKELAGQKEDSYAASEVMLLTPEIANTLPWKQ